MKTLLTFVGYIFIILVGTFLFFVFNSAFKAMTKPENPEIQFLRAKIEYCWNDYNRKSLDESTKRFIASTCEKLEDDLKKLGGRL